MSTVTASAPSEKQEKFKSAKAQRTIKRISLYTVMTVVALVMILPFYNSLVTSFRMEFDIQVKPIKFWPEQFTFKNYSNFFTQLKNFKAPIDKVMFNTFFVVFSIIAGSLLTCSLSAYSLARLNWNGKKVIMTIFYLSMMVPGVATLIPSYSVVYNLNLTNSKLGVIIPGLFSIYGVLFLRSFFLSTPKEIAEAARIDGAGEFRIFVTLYLRMILPGLITLGLFTFNGNWNSYLWPKIILRDKSDYVLALAIRDFQVFLSPTDQGTIMAASLVTVLPTVALFIAGQKYFMDNLAFTGIK